MRRFLTLLSVLLLISSTGFVACGTPGENGEPTDNDNGDDDDDNGDDDNGDDDGDDDDNGDDDNGDDPDFPAFTDVATGSEHTCAILDDDTLWCWGSDSDGSLGLGEDERNQDVYRPRQVGDDDNWRSVTAGQNHSCAIRDDDSLWCWGSNNAAQLGIDEDFEAGQLDNYSPNPTQVGDDDDWHQVDAGSEHTCGVRDDESLWCWGSNNRDQLGPGDDPFEPIPRRVGDLTWHSVAAGEQHTCAIRADDALLCWGDPGEGRLGIGTDQIGDTYDTPQIVDQDHDWEQLEVGIDHGCALRDDDTLWCWGHSGDDGTTSPEQIGEQGWRDLSAGGSATGVVDAEGQLWNWDRDEMFGFDDELDGQLGVDDDWLGAAVDGMRGCGLRDDDSLWCWSQWAPAGTYDEHDNDVDRTEPNPVDELDGG